jgi:stage II sporulation protein P
LHKILTSDSNCVNTKFPSQKPVSLPRFLSSDSNKKSPSPWKYPSNPTVSNNNNHTQRANCSSQEACVRFYKVVHDKTIHDYPAFSGSYNRSAETVNKALKEYPSIKIAIDVHRDTITSGNDKIAPVVNINGKEAAQVMLVMGSQTGSVTNYPNWRQNLRLATKLQYVFESNYPQFARAMLLKSAKYNQHLTTGSILIEVGSDANTFEQAKYSAQLVGQSLTILLNSQ